MIEAVKLFDGQGKKGGVNWVKVSEYMNGTRSSSQCVNRWNNILQPRMSGNVLTTPWNEEEVQ